MGESSSLQRRGLRTIHNYRFLPSINCALRACHKSALVGGLLRLWSPMVFNLCKNIWKKSDRSYVCFICINSAIRACRIFFLMALFPIHQNTVSRYFKFVIHFKVPKCCELGKPTVLRTWIYIQSCQDMDPGNCFGFYKVVMCKYFCLFCISEKIKGEKNSPTEKKGRTKKIQFKKFPRGKTSKLEKNQDRKKFPYRRKKAEQKNSTSKNPPREKNPSQEKKKKKQGKNSLQVLSGSLLYVPFQVHE